MNLKNRDFNKNSWIVVAVALWVFPPVGFVLALTRCLFEKKLHEYGEDYILQPAIAAIALSIFEILLMGVIGGRSGATLYIAGIWGLSIIGGIIMLVTRHKYIVLDEQTDLCMTLIEKGYFLEISEISEYMLLPVNEVEKLIEYLMNEKRLTGFNLDTEHHKLIATAPYKYFRFNCKSCGADQQLMRGRDITCPYCGSPVS